MKDFLWGICAATVKEILHDDTTVDSLRADFNGKMEQVVTLIEKNNSELFSKGKVSAQTMNQESLIKDVMDFYQEIFNLSGSSSTNTHTFTNDPFKFNSQTFTNGPFQFNSQTFTNGNLFGEEDEDEEFDEEADIAANRQSHECSCPNLLAGHLRNCNYNKTTGSQKIVSKETWQAGLNQKTGVYSSLAKDAVLLATTEAQINHAIQLGIPYTEFLEEGDLLLVEDSPNGYFNVNGPYLATVTNPDPDESNSEEGFDAQIAVVESFGKTVSEETYCLCEDDQITVLRRDGRPVGDSE